MLRNTLIHFIICTLFCFALVSCSSLTSVSIDNLAWVSMRRPEPKDIADAEPNPSNDIVVNFTTDRDLREIAEQYEFNIGVDAYFCRGSEMDISKPLQANPYIFDSLGKIDAFKKRNLNNKPAEKNYYRVYISTKSVALAGQNVFSYDLERDANNICIRLRGGNMLGGRFISNIVLIAKGDIVSVLAPR